MIFSVARNRPSTTNSWAKRTRFVSSLRNRVVTVSLAGSGPIAGISFGIQESLFAAPHHFVTEDVTEYQRSCDLLGIGSYHVVVGNPPYITPKDPQENENYRVYQSCSGQCALSVPFAERMFKLAKIADPDGRGSGFVGQITANSFMDREFGRKLIEEYLSQKVNLTYVIDTSGAHIPGHGTPTVILIGRRVTPSGRQTVRAVLGVRGEPGEPDDAEKGHVWQAIVDQVDRPGSESEWVSVEDLDRRMFSKYPWNLSGGGAAEVKSKLEEHADSRISDHSESIGRTTASGADEVFILPAGATAARLGDDQHVRPLVVGDDVRDFRIRRSKMIRSPYKDLSNKTVVSANDWLPSRSLWFARTLLRSRVIFGRSLAAQGKPWYVHLENYPSKLHGELAIGFAFVSTHNHFVLDRAGSLFNRTSPMIKLPEGASEDEHLALLGVLNSSAACFWLKQVCHDKGNRGEGGGITSTAWERFFEFTGTKLQEFPLPADLPTVRARELDQLAQKLSVMEPDAVCAEAMPTRQRLDVARAEYARVRRRMIALQEELDWDVYRRYRLTSENDAAEVVAESGDVPEVNLGERAFEIILAQSGEDPVWFDRHGSTPITEIPGHWPEAYKRVVEARIRVIEERSRDIGLIERPECKRRWSDEAWEKKEAAALKSWLLDRCEERALWFDDAGNPRALTVNRLADLLRADADVVSVARLYAGNDADLAAVLTDIVADEHVPYLAALRYKEPGLRKRSQWESTWDQQREEDRTGTRLDIPVPPKYASSDFVRNSYWRNRGKLDVPKERFISYPGASPEGDRALMLAWAGFDHAQQAHVLTTLIDARATGDPEKDKERLTPLIAGLKEVMPWVRQWHGDKDEYGSSPADDYAAMLEEQKTAHGLSDADLDGWRPAKPTRGRRARTAPPSESPTLDDATD